MKLSIPTVIDTLFTTFIFFLLSFIILNYYIERQFAIAFSLILSVPVAMIVFKRLTTNVNKKRIKKDKLSAVERTANALGFYTTTERNELFLRAVTRAGYTAVRKRGGIFIDGKNSALFIRFGFNDVDKTDVVKIFNSIKSTEKAYILSKDFSQEILDFISRFDGRIIAVDGEKVYDFLKSQDCLPKDKLPFSTNKITKERLRLAFLDAKKAKRYFTFGLLFLLTSSFVPIKLYYVVFGCIFLIFALILKLFGVKKNPA
ncbi:MAG: hypothetical protein IJV95_03950 [Clostridia bacterium]|nr:hypothetical protein [Clostridia bacterium]